VTTIKPAKTYSCGHSMPLRGWPFDGYINEIWPTLGGSTIRVIKCFPCRNLTLPITDHEKDLL
jgi:hypothetical protein